MLKKDIMNPSNTWQTTLFTVACLLFVLVPLFAASPYRTAEFSAVIIYAIVLMGLNLVTGYSGQISLGHGAFYALGAYFGAVSLPYFGEYYGLMIPAAALVGLVVGYVIARPGIKLEGPFLALVTFALAIVVPGIIIALEEYTGGQNGLNVEYVTIPAWAGYLGFDDMGAFQWVQLNDDQWLYLITSLIAIFMFYIAFNLIKGTFGKATIAVRDNPIAASTMGIDVAKNKVQVFAISVMYATVGGSLLPLVVHFISPGSFSFYQSIYLLTAILVGGIASRLGPIYAAIYLVYMNKWLILFSTAAPALVGGFLIILIIIISPAGFDGILKGVYSWFRSRVKKDVQAGGTQ